MQKLKMVLNAVRRRRITIESDSLTYSFHDVPLKIIMNWLPVEASTRLRHLKSWGFPTHPQIKPTKTCNHRYELCPVSGQMHRPSGFMDVAISRSLLDEIGAYVFLTLLWDWGEPFMHPSAFEMIAQAHQRGIQAVSSTNGHLLGDLKKSSFREIWNGAAYHGFRGRLRSSDPMHNICLECSYAYKGGSCINQTVSEAVFFYDRGEA